MVVNVDLKRICLQEQYLNFVGSYQKLVAQLVDRSKPDELAKYTAFVIDSVNRVFTSPTERYSTSSMQRKFCEKIIKVLETWSSLSKGPEKLVDGGLSRSLTAAVPSHPP